MPAVDILIPNYQGGIALELCLESVARYTPESHRVIVYDDASKNPGELQYLVRAREKGLIDVLIAGIRHGGHGAALNVLVNGAGPHPEYVVLMDNDIQVLRSGWLTELLALADDPHVLIVASETAKPSFRFCSRGYMPGQYYPWFALLNMTGYRDGMAVDWSIDELRRADEPWLSECASIYPPENNLRYLQARATWGACATDFDPDKIIFDPGCVLWCKMRHENPGGYIHRELTPRILSSFRHWGHAQAWLESGNAETDKGRELRKRIPAELERLRGKT